MVGNYRDELNASKNAAGSFNKGVDTFFSSLRKVRTVKNQAIEYGYRFFPANLLSHMGTPAALKAVLMLAGITVGVGGLHWSSGRRTKYIKDFN